MIIAGRFPFAIPRLALALANQTLRYICFAVARYYFEQIALEQERCYNSWRFCILIWNCTQRIDYKVGISQMETYFRVAFSIYLPIGWKSSSILLVLFQLFFRKNAICWKKWLKRLLFLLFIVSFVYRRLLPTYSRKCLPNDRQVSKMSNDWYSQPTSFLCEQMFEFEIMR